MPVSPGAHLDELDYTTFGELSVIISSNWDVFGSLFSSKKAVEKVMASLNALEILSPIAVRWLKTNNCDFNSPCATGSG